MTPEPITPAGFRIRPWCAAVGIGDQLLFKMWREGHGPSKVKLGTRTIVTESPADYLARMAKESPAPARPAKPPAPAAPVQAAKPATASNRPSRPPTAPAKRAMATA